MRRQRVIKRIRYLRNLEIWNTISIPAMLAIVMTQLSITTWRMMVYAIVVMVFMFLQGALYWDAKHSSLIQRQPLLSTSFRTNFITLRWLNVVLLAVYPIVAIYGFISGQAFFTTDWWSHSVYGATLLVYINYYHWQISHDNPTDLNYVMTHQILRRSPLNTDLYPITVTITQPIRIQRPSIALSFRTQVPPQTASRPTASSQSQPLPTASSQSQPLPTASSQSQPLPTASSQSQPLPTTSSQSQPLPTTSSQSQPLPTTSSQSQPLPTISSQSQPLPTTSSQSQPLPTASSQSQPLPTASSQSQPLPTTSSQSQPLPTTSSQSQPLPTTSSQSQPLPTTSSQSQPLPTTSSQSQPLPTVHSTAIPAITQPLPIVDEVVIAENPAKAAVDAPTSVKKSSSKKSSSSTGIKRTPMQKLANQTPSEQSSPAKSTTKSTTTRSKTKPKKE